MSAIGTKRTFGTPVAMSANDPKPTLEVLGQEFLVGAIPQALHVADLYGVVARLGPTHERRNHVAIEFTRMPAKADCSKPCALATFSCKSDGIRPDGLIRTSQAHVTPGQ